MTLCSLIIPRKVALYVHSQLVLEALADAFAEDAALEEVVYQRVVHLALEELAEQHEIADEGLSELEFDLDDPDLDLADLSGLAEMGIGPLGMLSGFGSGVEEEELDFDFNNLKDEESEEINVDLR